MSTTTMRNPHLQPLRRAIALLVIAVLLLVAQVALEVIVRTVVADVVMGQGAMGIVALLSLGTGALVLALGLTALILAVMVTFKGEGKLRLGAGLMLAAAVFGLVVSFSVSGGAPQVSDTEVALSNASSVVESIVFAVRAVAMLAGAVILVLGIREVRRQRRENPLP